MARAALVALGVVLLAAGGAALGLRRHAQADRRHDAEASERDDAARSASSTATIMRRARTAITSAPTTLARLQQVQARSR